MKWAALFKSDIQKKRNQIFSDYLSDKKIENQLTLIDFEEELFSETIKELVKTKDIIRVTNSFGHELLSFFDNQTSQVMVLGSADTIVKEKELVYLRSAQYLCLLDLFQKKKFEVDVSKPGLVVGVGSLARYAISSLIQIGVNKIHITAEVDSASEEFLKSVKKFNFDIHVEYIPKEKLLLQQANHSIVINTIESDEGTQELFEELYYFNYLNDNSIVWELLLLAEESKFISEAKKLNLRTVDGINFCAETDLIWLGWKVKHDLSLEEYSEYLSNKLFS